MRKTLFLFSVILTLLVASCADNKKEEIQGKWYTDFTEQVGADMSAMLVLDFSENYMNLKVDFPDVVYVDAKGSYDVTGDVITPDFKKTKPEIGINPKLEEYLQGLGAGENMVDVFKTSMEQEFNSTAESSMLGDVGTLTIEEVTDSKLVLKDGKGETLTFTREKPYVKSALPDFKKMTGL